MSVKKCESIEFIRKYLSALEKGLVGEALAPFFVDNALQ